MHDLRYAKPNAHVSNAHKFALAAVGWLIGKWEVWYFKWNALQCAITLHLMLAVVWNFVWRLPWYTKPVCIDRSKIWMLNRKCVLKIRLQLPVNIFLELYNSISTRTLKLKNARVWIWALSGITWWSLQNSSGFGFSITWSNKLSDIGQY